MAVAVVVAMAVIIMLMKSLYFFYDILFFGIYGIIYLFILTENSINYNKKIKIKIQIRQISVSLN